jgi:hypothetical protein
MPFTHKNLKRDLDDLGSNFDASPGLEFGGPIDELPPAGWKYAHNEHFQPR